MDSAIVTLVTSLIGAGAALLGVHIANKSNTGRLVQQLDHERQRKNEQRRMERLENLYLLLDAWLNNLGAFTLPYLSVMEGKLAYDEALGLQTRTKIEVDFGRIDMMVHVHFFSELLPSFRALLAARDRMNDIKAEHRRRYAAGEQDGRKFIEPFKAACLELDRCGRMMKVEITKIAHA